MKQAVYYLISYIFISLLCSCAKKNDALPTVAQLDISKYAGEWHEVGRLPTPFQKNMIAAKATYDVLPDGSLSVKNEGLKGNGKYSSINGRVTTPDVSEPGKLKVRFNKFPVNLFQGDYWILSIDKNYTYATVGSPTMRYLWLLSKDLDAQKSDFSAQLKNAQQAGFSIDQIFYNPDRIK